MDALGITLKAASADITPQLPLPLFGRVGRTEAAREIVSRLEVNCLLIGDCNEQFHAIVSLDSLYSSQLLMDAVLRICSAGGLHFEENQLLIIASHTHNAPALDATKPKLGQLDSEYVEYSASRIAAKLIELQSEPAQINTLAYGQSICTASCFRRRRLPGIDLARRKFSMKMVMAPRFEMRVDQALKLLVFNDPEGVPSAVLWSWPCHAVIEPKESSVSADFPGMMREYIREIFADNSLPVLYFPGFSGDIRPASRSALPVHKNGQWIGIGPRFERKSERNAGKLRASLLRSFDEAWATARPCGCIQDMVFTQTRSSLEISEIRSQSEGLAPLTCDRWSFGPITIKAVSGEISSGYGGAAGEGDSLTFLTGCAGQVFGYIPLDCQIKEGGYEVDGFAPAFSVPGHFKSKVETLVSRLIG